MHPIFISYARKTSAEPARALHRALGEDLAFLDESDIDGGERFPEHIVDELLASRVVVVFPDETYFSRPYCLWELRTALGPFLDACGDDGDSDERLAHVVVALPAKGKSAELHRFPKRLQSINWRSADDAEGIADLVRKRLDAASHTLGERYAAIGRSEADVRAECLTWTVNQRPEKLAGLPTYHPPPGWPLSKGDRFFGRADDLWHIDFVLDTLRGGDDAAACLSGAIEGIGGVGKTQLALEYVLRFGRRQFPGGIFWMDAEKGLDEQHHGILQALNPAVPDFVTFSKDGRKATAELSGALERASANGGRILFVIDNIPEDSDGKLSRWCPALNNVTVLATSRAKRSGNDSTLHIPVGVLAPDAAVQLLSSGVTSTAQAADWQAVAEWVGRLPLALTLLNAALYSKATTIQDLARTARGPASQTAELDDLRKALGTGTSEEALRGISEAFSISYSLLPPEAQDAARLLARLAPAPLPEVLVSALGLPPSVRVLLRARSFVTDEGSTLSGAEPSVSNFGAMHRVLADFLRTRADSPADEWERLRGSLVALLTSLDSAPGQWREMQACMAHARHVLRNRPCPPPEPDAAFAEFALSFSNCLGSLMQLEEAAATALEAAKAYGRLVEARADVVPDWVRALNNLSNSLSDLGRKEEAHAVIELTVRVSRRLAEVIAEAMAEAMAQGLEWLLAMSLQNLSNRLSELGRTEEAHAAVQEAVEIRRRLAAARPEALPDLAMSLNNLSVQLRNLGRREEAHAAVEEAVRMYWRLVETMPEAFEPDLAGTLNNLSVYLSDLGRREEAHAAVEEAVRMYRRLAEGRREAFEPYLAGALANLSGGLSDLGRREEAHAAIEEAVKIRRRLAEARPEAFEPNLATSLHNLSLRLSELGEREKGLKTAEEAVRLFRKLAKTWPAAFQSRLNTAEANLEYQQALRAWNQLSWWQRWRRRRERPHPPSGI